MSDQTERCGFTVIDSEGDEQPCDRVATGWRWYQGQDHEDMLDAACEFHENEGGRRIHAAETAQAELRAEVERLTEANDILRDISNVNGNWNLKYGAAMDRAEAAEARVRELEAILGDSRCGDVPALVQAWTDSSARVRELEAAVQELRDAHQAEVEKVGRVEALADEWADRRRSDRMSGSAIIGLTLESAAADLRAALSDEATS